MKLTNAEKLTILLLCDIQDGKKECNAEFIRNAIFQDHTWAIPWEMSGVDWMREEVPAYVNEVTGILDMLSFLEASYAGLNPEDKAKVDSEKMSSFLKYQGFDGNNEGRYLSCVWFLVEQMGRYTEVKGRERLNSHRPMLQTYKRMVSSWESIRDRDVGIELLSADDIIAIISAANFSD